MKALKRKDLLWLGMKMIYLTCSESTIYSLVNFSFVQPGEYRNCFTIK